MKLADITPAPWNARKITPESVKELAESIKEQGLLQPIIVWKDGDGNALCIAGNRRLAAMKSIGYDLADEEVIDFLGDENGARAVTIAENLQREDISILEEAAAVTALLDCGMNVATVAAKIGKSTAWVNRRRKLTALADEWRERADRMDADALEKIAAYPVEVQKRVAKISYNATTWRELYFHFERESRDLDTAFFDTTDCRACLKRTGCEADLFGVVDGDLGKCQDCACFKKREEAYQKELIEKATKGIEEVVVCKYEWETPSDAVKKRDKTHPCAYVFVDGGEAIVRWGESKKAKEARLARERELRETKSASGLADRTRADEITRKLDDYYERDQSWPVELVRKVEAHIVKSNTDENIEAWLIDAICSKFCEWHDSGEWADILATFDWSSKLADVSDEDAQWLVERERKIRNENNDENE